MGAQKLPPKCGCGEYFIVFHAMHCAQGGFEIVRRNETRDTLAILLHEIGFDVEIEPTFQPL